MFPGAHSQVYYNEDGEVLGWDEPMLDLEYVPYEEEEEQDADEE